LLLQVAQFSFVYTGLSHGVPAGLSSLILGMAPLLVGLLTPLVLATRIGVAPVLGLLIGAGGVYIVLSDELGGGLGAQVVFPLLGMLALTSGTLYQKRFNDDTPVTTSVVVQMLTSLVATVVAMPRVDVPAAAVAVDGARQRAAEPRARDDGADRGAGAGRGPLRAGGAGARGGAGGHVRRARPGA
jgi:drug/metabolite transporter (DMT)-like permease